MVLAICVNRKLLNSYTHLEGKKVAQLQSSFLIWNRSLYAEKCVYATNKHREMSITQLSSHDGS